MHVKFNIPSHIAIFSIWYYWWYRVFTRPHTRERDSRKIKRCRIVSTGVHPNREGPEKAKKKKERRAYPLTHVYARPWTRSTRTHACQIARLGFRIHLVRTIDPECTSEIELPSEPSQKSSYLYSLLVAWRLE